MKIYLLLILLSVFNNALSQERNDEIMVVQMMETNAVDLKCEIYPYSKDYFKEKEFDQQMRDLIANGRYIKSISTTKFGTVVLHEQNTHSIEQQYERIYTTKEINKKFKNGFAIKYYNKEHRYTLFEKNPKITKQKLEKKPWSDKKTAQKLADMNAKGFFLVTMIYDEMIMQDGRDDITEQVYNSCYGSAVLSEVEKMQEKGYTVGYVNKNYSDYANLDTYEIIFEKPRDGNLRKQCIATIKTQGFFVDFLSQRVTPGYNLNMTWSGWPDIDYEKRNAELSEPDTNIWDVLSGLANTVSGLAGGTTGSNTTMNATNIENTNKTQQKKTVNNPKKEESCSHCHGTGICNYCNGDGYNYVAGNPVKCTACTGLIGQCKWCKGSGKKR